MPRYDDDDDDDRPSRRKYRDEDDDDDDDDITPVRSKNKNNGFALSSMILGLVGFCVPLICGLLAMLFGFMGLARSKVTGTGKGMAIAGIILGFINGIIEPSIIGYAFYYTRKKAIELHDTVEAEIQAEQKRRLDEQKAFQKKWDDDQKKIEQDRIKRDQDNKTLQNDFTKKMNEDRLKQEQDRKEFTRNQDEGKILNEVARARTNILTLENACRAYTIRNKNKLPTSLQDLLNPPGGGQPLVNPVFTPLKDPWGMDYQLDASHKSPNGNPDPVVFTLHPKTGERILASNRK